MSITHAGKVEDSHRQTRSCPLNRCIKNSSVQLRFDGAILKGVGFVFVDTLYRLVDQFTCIHVYTASVFANS